MNDRSITFHDELLVIPVPKVEGKSGEFTSPLELQINRLLMDRAEHDTLIVANLREEEFKAFHKAGILYSGETGISTSWTNLAPYWDNTDLAPYIASYFNYLEQIINTLRWRQSTVTLTRSGTHVQWVVRRQ